MSRKKRSGTLPSSEDLFKNVVPEKCACCDLPEGDDRDGLGPLGPMETCDLCKKRVCSVCFHEADCCFAEADDHAEEPNSAPYGWKPVDPAAYQLPTRALVYERIQPTLAVERSANE